MTGRREPGPHENLVAASIATSLGGRQPSAETLWLLRDFLAELRGEPPPPPRSKRERYELRTSCLDCRVGLCVPVEVYLPGLQDLTIGDVLHGEVLDAEHRTIRERMEQAARAQLERGLKTHRDQGHRISEVQRMELPA